MAFSLKDAESTHSDKSTRALSGLGRKRTDTVSSSTRMESDMKEILKTVNSMERAFAPGQTDLSTKDSSRMVEDMAKE